MNFSTLTSRTSPKLQSVGPSSKWLGENTATSLLRGFRTSTGQGRSPTVVGLPGPRRWDSGASWASGRWFLSCLNRLTLVAYDSRDTTSSKSSYDDSPVGRWDSAEKMKSKRYGEVVCRRMVPLEPELSWPRTDLQRCVSRMIARQNASFVNGTVREKGKQAWGTISASKIDALGFMTSLCSW